MAITVITLKKVPPALKGELTRWMQEIATGVYIGNFNSRIRDELWNIVINTKHTGEATLSYETNNEIGYSFKTLNTKRRLVNSDGIPLVYYPFQNESSNFEKGFSNAYKYHVARKRQKRKRQPRDYVFIDIETTGLNLYKNEIIEIGALKKNADEISTFNSLIKINKKLPSDITKLTNISDEMLKKDGRDIKEVLIELVEFIENRTIVGYNINFDFNFINKALEDNNLCKIKNETFDLLSYVRKQNKHLVNYKFQTVLNHYNIEIDNEKFHRGLTDAKLTYKLFLKLNENF